ncbi:hypothetical protein BRADI_2g50125v3 [Brachypodium distachyon]|uniref:Uncharacterized protein n=1 Tax=Brachypodium distachyon TaxID=15368 RepID=A0A0Q3IVV9_BRADI|nr:hypothetical protein BRADI_2g50125v3 [Brachypodium distachyon]
MPPPVPTARLYHHLELLLPPYPLTSVLLSLSPLMKLPALASSKPRLPWIPASSPGRSSASPAPIPFSASPCKHGIPTSAPQHAREPRASVFPASGESAARRRSPRPQPPVLLRRLQEKLLSRVKPPLPSYAPPAARSRPAAALLCRPPPHAVGRLLRRDLLERPMGSHWPWPPDQRARRAAAHGAAGRGGATAPARCGAASKGARSSNTAQRGRAAAA